MKTVLYIHGMGGGGDSRIPSILKEESAQSDIRVVVRTYDFDQDIATLQITLWVQELEPDLVIGESLGALHAIRSGVLPCLLVSPALNASYYFELLSWLTLIPGVTKIFDRIYRPREGDRQKLHFTRKILRKYKGHRRKAVSSISGLDEEKPIFAFFGSSDHYRRSGIVSVKTWEQYFGKSYDIYDGTHFMEEQYVRTILFDKVLEVLGINI